MKKLLLIDANSIIHRSFHALPPFTAPDGSPSGAIYGIASILLKLWREERPDYAAALFDRPEPTFRDEKYAEYKAQRPPAPDELISQIIEAHKLFEAFGIMIFEKAGYEADDLIATLAERFKTMPDLQVVILTGDRDTLQMVEGDKLVVQTFNKGVSDTTIYNEGAVKEKYGLAPNQLVDYKALVGDTSDNIKGVPGVGPKTAVELIKRFGTVKEMYRQLERPVVGGAASGSAGTAGRENVELEKIRRKFGPFKKDAELSEMLVTLERHAPIDIPPIEDLRPAEGTTAIEAYFEKMQFAALLKRLIMPSASETAQKPPKEKPRNPGTPLF
jgi:DNA polymerase I